MPRSHADIAVSFGRAVRDRDFEDAVALFGPDKIQLVDELRARHNLPLGDDLEFFLRRLRCAVRALNGDIKSVSARQMDETDELVTVLLTFECEHSRQELSVEFDRDGNAVNLSSPDSYTPPSYADASDFEEYSITLDAERTELDAIATVPTSSESVPVVVLVPGAGEIDKDATVGPNKLFQDIAWGLATENIATLRYDKRETVTEIPEEQRTLENLYFTDGVRAAQRAAKRVDTDSVVFVGHSQGGRCAFEMARQYGDAGGVAALDPPVIKPLEGDGQQLRTLLEIDGMVPPHCEQAVENYRTRKEAFHSQSADDQPSVFLNSVWNYTHRQRY
jgi:dienelactone hydrolase